ncbi:glycosyl hydrolase family 28-related protein [Paenibacillus sp. YAF4_2]|uniref:glycosyl hydrolase family 28-related protein n=1 Tax=Paenibacillus sp. YAF4_2 TaxID=3233085 RepID=UPI003F9AF942
MKRKTYKYGFAALIAMAALGLAAYSLLFEGHREAEPQKINRYENSINVRDVGAKGDGKTDDTAAIQQAIDSAVKSNLIVYMPNGTYIVDPQTPLIIPSGTKLYGDGVETVIKGKPGAFGWDLLRIKGKGIKVRNIGLDGSNAVNRVVVIQAGSNDVMIANAFITNASQSDDTSSPYYSQMVAGIVVYGETDLISIADSEVSNISAKHPTSGTYIAHGIHVTTTWKAQETAPKQVVITGNYIHDVGPADNSDCIYYEDPNRKTDQAVATGSIIRDNRFAKCAKRAIQIYADGVTIEGNQITNGYLNNNYYIGSGKTGQLAPDMYAGISINADDAVVRNNMLSGTGSYYAALEIGVYEPISHITVAGNKVTMGVGSNINDTTAIRIGNVNGFSITDNTLSHGAKGIWTWLSASNGVITGNAITMPEGGGIDLSTYLNEYFQTKITCQDNTIDAYLYLVHSTQNNKEMKLVRNG